MGVAAGVTVGGGVGAPQVPAAAFLTKNLFPSPLPLNVMQYVSVPTVTVALTVAGPLGIGNPPLPDRLRPPSGPALFLGGVRPAFLYVNRLQEGFATQFAHGMVRVTRLVPSSSSTDAP